MTEVNFTEETTPTMGEGQQRTRGFYKLVVQLGLAKDEAGAKVVLIIAIIILFGIAIAYPFIFG
jgi:hypothetical protein